MSNLTKLEVLKHRHLSLLKKLEEHGIEVRYSQIEGEWQVTLPDAPINAIEVTVEGDAERLRNAFLAEPLPPKTIAQLLDMTAKAVGSPPQTIMGIPFIEVDGIDKLRAFLVNNVQPDGPIVIGADFGVEVPQTERPIFEKLAPRALYTKPCPVDFGNGGSPFNYPQMYARDWYEMDEQGDVSFHRDAEKNVPDWVRGFDERQGMSKRAVNSDDALRQSMLAAGIRSIIGVKDDEVLSVGAVGVYRTPLTPSLYHLTEAIHHAILSAASAKA